jgi:hypothetical protein
VHGDLKPENIVLFLKEREEISKENKKIKKIIIDKI